MTSTFWYDSRGDFDLRGKSSAPTATANVNRTVSARMRVVFRDARTSCRTSSILLTVLGSCLTKVRIASANRNVRSARSRGFAPSSILELGFLAVYLELGPWDLGFAVAAAA